MHVHTSYIPGTLSCIEFRIIPLFYIGLFFVHDFCFFLFVCLFVCLFSSPLMLTAALHLRITSISEFPEFIGAGIWKEAHSRDTGWT